MMKKIIPLLLTLTICINAFGQKNDSTFFRGGDWVVGLGLGTKCQFGNWGFATNIFLTRNFNINISAGGGEFNNNGLLFSLGPEYCKRIVKNKFILLGSVWTRTSDDYSVDDSPQARDLETFSDQYIRTYAGILFGDGGAFVKIEIGYSYVLYQPTYILHNPGNWTTKQINQVERTMNSGLMVSINFGGVFSLLHHKRK